MKKERVFIDPDQVDPNSKFGFKEYCDMVNLKWVTITIGFVWFLSTCVILSDWPDVTMNGIVVNSLMSAIVGTICSPIFRMMFEASINENSRKD